MLQRALNNMIEALTEAGIGLPLVHQAAQERDAIQQALELRMEQEDDNESS
jgi:hypothetical protein